MMHLYLHIARVHACVCMSVLFHNSKKTVLRAAKIKFIIEIKLRGKIKFTMWK